MLETLKQNWSLILSTLKETHELTDVSFRTWIEPLEVLEVEDHMVKLLYKGDKNAVSFIEKRYKFFIQVAIEEVTKLKLEPIFVTSAQQTKNSSMEKKSDSYMTLSTMANLNPRYTFDTFVVGSNNKMAHAASLAVAESPGEVYNPLFIYGGVGLGKTHLMHSIAHFILKKDPSMKVLYASSETFTNDLIDAIRGKNNFTTTDFREKYRKIDVLLIDDIQFITKKEGTQEEIFHTFNTLYESKKQIIISSDRSPKELETLEERLRSRFEWGLIADIGSPDYETRMAILRKKEEMEGYNIDNEVIQYIATNIKSNIRELEGALTKVVATSRLTKSDITLALAEEALKDHISLTKVKEITPEHIIEVVADHFNVRPADISSEKRTKDISDARQIAMYLCCDMTKASLQQIARIMKKKDHTTVMHGRDKITKDLENNENLQYTINVIRKKLNPM